MTKWTKDTTDLFEAVLSWKPWAKGDVRLDLTTGIEAYWDGSQWTTVVVRVGASDNRSGLTAADGAAIKLVDHLVYNFPALTVFRVSCEICAHAYTSGTPTYTVTWTENGVPQTAVVTAAAVNVVAGIVRLAMPDAGTDIVVQLTTVFVATCRVFASVERMGP